MSAFKFVLTPEAVDDLLKSGHTMETLPPFSVSTAPGRYIPNLTEQERKRYNRALAKGFWKEVVA